MLADTPAAIVRALADLPMRARPGDRWAYNQSGYLLAGMIVRKLSGTRFDEFCRKRIFEPLGMSTARFGGSKVLIPGRATYYEKDDQGRLRPYFDGVYTLAGVAPAAGLNVSVKDMARFVIALEGGKP